MSDENENEFGMALPVKYDAEATAEAEQRRNMHGLSIRIAVLRGLHGTWPDNAQHAARELWHYASRAIAGDY